MRVFRLFCLLAVVGSAALAVDPGKKKEEEGGGAMAAEAEAAAAGERPQPRSKILSVLGIFCTKVCSVKLKRMKTKAVRYFLEKLSIISFPKVHRSYKEGIAKLRVVFRSAGPHLRNGTKQ
jgi:hypothetical protein